MEAAGNNARAWRRKLAVACIGLFLGVVNTANPTIALARERVQEAYDRLREVQLAWLPDLRAGPAYQRHDGEIQNAAGFVFETSKSNLFIGGGAVMAVDTSEAIFGP